MIVIKRKAYMIVIKRKAPKNMISGTLCYVMDNEV